MTTYRIKGKRYLRKYTAPAQSPVYAAAADVADIAASLCFVPWEATAVENAVLTSHDDKVEKGESESGLDKNVSRRESFDAALFCAGHKNGMHTAYANAACYRYTIPDEAVGAAAEAIVAHITSDPYNAAGARISVLTNSTGEIPTDCATCRTGIAHAEGVAPRIVTPVDGVDYWYTNSASATVALPGGTTLQKYLFVFVLLENYNTSRGNWIEGSAYMRNSVELQLADAIPGWSATEVIDLSGAGSRSIAVVSDGVLSRQTGEGLSGARKLDVPLHDAVRGVHVAYSSWFAGAGELSPSKSGDRGAGAKFLARIAGGGRQSPLSPGYVFEIDAAALVVSVALPCGFTAKELALSYPVPNLADGAYYAVYLAKGNRAIDEETLKNPSAYDLRSSVDGWTFVGRIDGGTSKTLPISVSPDDRAATVAIFAYLPPEAFDAGSPDWQGAPEFIPDITIR